MHPDTSGALIYRACSKAPSFSELVLIAQAELEKFEGPIEIVCGPITSGGVGSRVENLAIFNAAILKLRLEGRPIFSQMPYEDALDRLGKAFLRNADRQALEYDIHPILTEFYEPLFACGRINFAWFLSNWHTSKGASWERKVLPLYGIGFADLSQEWFDALLE